MGYNISETTGASGGGSAGLDTWTLNVTLNGTGVTTVSGDFDEIPLGGGGATEASNGYSVGAPSTSDFGTITSFNAADGTFTFTIDRAAVFDSGSDQTVTFTVTGDDGGASDTDTVILNLLICVARGTLIETASGPVPVEDLRRGDMVRTADGRAQPVRWIGSRRVSAFELARDPALHPVRITAGALGAGRPARDLLVSPQHRVLIEDWRAELMFGEGAVLVPAKALVDGTSVRIEAGLNKVEYFHVLFDAHEIMLTEGLPTESFHPGQYALREMDRAARDEVLRLFPDLADGQGVPPTACMALRPWEGRLLRGALADRADGVALDLRMAS